MRSPLRSSGGTVLLWLAAARGHTAVVEAVLARGAVGTPATGHAAVIAVLLTHGVSDAALTSSGTALGAAVAGGHLEAVRLLLARLPDDALRNWQGQRQLAQAAAKGHAEVVRALVAKGANPNGGGPGTASAIVAAAAEGRTGTVEALLALGADPTVTDNSGVSALWRAAERGDVTTAELLLAHGADPNSGVTPGRYEPASNRRIAFPGREGHALALVRQADGKLVTGGPVFQDGNYDFALERHEADGTLDRTFGHDVPDL